MSRYYRSILNVQGVAPAFAPTDIAGCQLWLDASDATTISIGTGVSQWNDKSGQGNNATQEVGANQPSYQTAIQNGLNVVRFDGSNDVLNASSVTTGNNKTIFIAYKPISVTENERVVFDSVTTTQAILYKDETQKYSTAFGTLFTSATNIASSPQFNTILHSGASSEIKLNGSSIGTGNFGTNAFNGFRLAAARGTAALHMEMDVYEVIIYNSVLSGADQTSVETYLSTKWAI